MASNGLDGDVFLAFGRVFSGVARTGMSIHIMSSAFNPNTPDLHRQTSVLGQLFMMMGRGLERMEVRAIVLLEKAILS